MNVRPQDLEERFIRASGPGGQNVNKVATAVQLRFNVRSSVLPEPVKQRLRAIAGSKLTADDVLVIDSRAFRTQARNREAARERLDTLIRKASVRPKKRRRTALPAAARERRLRSKQRRAELKAQRRGGATE